jgi:hypothetical protein
MSSPQPPCQPGSVCPPACEKRWTSGVTLSSRIRGMEHGVRGRGGMSPIAAGIMRLNEVSHPDCRWFNPRHRGAAADARRPTLRPYSGDDDRFLRQRGPADPSPRAARHAATSQAPSRERRSGQALGRPKPRSPQPSPPRSGKGKRRRGSGSMCASWPREPARPWRSWRRLNALACSSGRRHQGCAPLP